MNSGLFSVFFSNFSQLLTNAGDKESKKWKKNMG